MCQHARGGLDDQGHVLPGVEASTTVHGGPDLPLDGVANSGTVWIITASVIELSPSLSGR